MTLCNAGRGDNGESFIRAYIYVLPTKSFRQEKPSQLWARSCRQISGPVKPSISKAGQTKTLKKQSRGKCLPEQPQHMDEIIPSEIHMA